MKTVIVCDSGLGGLNIASGFFNEANRGFEACRLIYFNAYPAKDAGFNKLPTERSQEELFREVLESMKKFSPDMCLIACNTLSIVYERLAKWYTPEFPVVGIVDAAVEKMFDALQKNPGSQLLILGTKSTVESQVYAKKLIGKGVDPERICGLGCPGLATLLEADPDAPEVVEKIAQYAAEAEKLIKNKIKNPAPGRTRTWSSGGTLDGAKLFLALCCTHFEFAEKFWIREFDRLNPGNVEIVNPNKAFTAEIFPAECKYVSRIEFFPGAKEAMIKYFAGITPLTLALANAVCDPELFRFQ